MVLCSDVFKTVVIAVPDITLNFQFKKTMKILVFKKAAAWEKAYVTGSRVQVASGSNIARSSRHYLFFFAEPFFPEITRIFVASREFYDVMSAYTRTTLYVMMFCDDRGNLAN